MLVARTLADGTLDTSFDPGLFPNGYTTIPMVENNTDAAEAMILSAGKPVVAGLSASTTSAVLRLESNHIFSNGLD